MKYPPFCDIIVIGFSSGKEEDIKKQTSEFYKELLENTKNQLNNLKISLPAPSPIDKIQNRYRWRIIIKGNMTEELNNILNNILKKWYDKNIKDTKITIDVNPNNMI